MNADSLMTVARTQIVQMALVIAAVSAITVLFCRRRPHLAYAIWLVALAKCLAPPLVSSPTSIFSWAWATHPLAGDVATDRQTVEHPRIPADASASPIGTVASPITKRVWPISAYISFAWAGGIVATIVFPLMRCAHLRRRLQQTAVAPRNDLIELYEALCVTLAIRHPARLVVSSESLSPALLGVIRPLIVIPQSMLGPSVDQLRPILAHELIHLRRKDAFVAALQWIATALWWFNPLVWRMNRQINRARELSCDEEVIASLRCEPVSYAQVLIDALRLQRGSPAPTFLLGVSAMQMTRGRLAHLTDESTRFHRRTPLACWAALVVCALLLLPGAGLALENPNKPATEASVVPGKSISFTGSIVDKETGKGIEGAIVTVHRQVKGKNENYLEPTKPTEHQTDAQGKFKFDVASEPGLYIELDVRHPNYASRNGEGYGLSLIQKDLENGQQPWFSRIEIAPAEQVTGVIEDYEGKPLAGVAIHYVSVGGALENRMIAMDGERCDDVTKTDEKGRFRFGAIKGSLINDFWAKPADKAILFHSVRDQRGDLGSFRLEGGVKVSGAVLDDDGKGVANASVVIESVEKNEVMLPISRRFMTTDASGHFEFAPVKPGAHVMSVSELRESSPQGEMRSSRLPGVFLPQPITVFYKDYNKFPPVEIHTTPHMTVRVQYLDGKFQPTRGHGVNLSTRKNGENYLARGRIDDSGLIEMLAPKGWGEAKLHISTDPFSVLRYRRGTTGDLHAGSEIDLGALDSDITDLFIVRYKAPAVLIRAVGPDGKALAGIRSQIVYRPGTLPEMKGRWLNGLKGDVGFEKLDDRRFRTSQLLPDEEFTLTVEADGFKPDVQKMTLKEGETRELEVKLAAGK